DGAFRHAHCVSLEWRAENPIIAVRRGGMTSMQNCALLTTRARWLHAGWLHLAHKEKGRARAGAAECKGGASQGRALELHPHAEPELPAEPAEERGVHAARSVSGEEVGHAVTHVLDAEEGGQAVEHLRGETRTREVVVEGHVHRRPAWQGGIRYRIGQIHGVRDRPHDLLVGGVNV